MNVDLKKLKINDDALKIVKSKRAFRKLSIEQRKQLYVDVFNQFSEKLGISPPPGVLFDGIGSEALQKGDPRNPFKDRHCIMLGKGALRSPSQFFIACHEFGHIVEFNEMEVRPNSHLSQEYIKNHEKYYVGGFLTFGKYYNQPVERDANKFAIEVFKENNLKKPWTYFLEKGLAKVGKLPNIPSPEGKFTKIDGVKLAIGVALAIGGLALTAVGPTAGLVGILAGGLGGTDLALGPYMKISANNIKNKELRKQKKEALALEKETSKKVKTQKQGSSEYLGLMVKSIPSALSMLKNPLTWIGSVGIATTKWNFRKAKSHEVKDRLIHVTRNKETLDAIMKSGHLRGYAGKKIYFFNGVPDYKLFGTQSYGNEDAFLESHPERIMYGVETACKDKKLLTRPYYDESIMHKGNFELQDAKEVQLVLDVKEGKKGKKELYIRKRSDEEIRITPNKHTPNPDLIKYLENHSKEYRLQQKINKSKSIKKVILKVIHNDYVMSKALNHTVKRMFKCTAKTITRNMLSSFRKVSNLLKNIKNSQRPTHKLTSSRALNI